MSKVIEDWTVLLKKLFKKKFGSITNRHSSLPTSVSRELIILCVSEDCGKEEQEVVIIKYILLYFTL